MTRQLSFGGPARPTGGPCRNLPCSCGSGKKFKKCCWNNFNALGVEDTTEYSEAYAKDIAKQYYKLTRG
jgi:hypothetical protein